MADRRLYAILAGIFSNNLNGGSKKETKPRRNKQNGLWKMTPLWKSTKGVDSHRGLEKPAGFSTFPHKARRWNLN
jgi:hypothetical protein